MLFFRWAHSRAADDPHQLHFDLDENQLRRGKKHYQRSHPVSSSSSSPGPCLPLRLDITRLSIDQRQKPCSSPADSQVDPPIPVPFVSSDHTSLCRFSAAWQHVAACLLITAYSGQSIQAVCPLSMGISELLEWNWCYCYHNQPMISS